jgi:hypothetical protein
MLILFLLVDISLIQAQEERLGIGECLLGDNTTIADAISVAIKKSKADAISSFGVYIEVESNYKTSEINNEDYFSETIRLISGGVIREKPNTRNIELITSDNSVKVKVSAIYILDKKSFDYAINRYIDDRKLDKQHKRNLAIEQEKTLQLDEKNKFERNKKKLVETKKEDVNKNKSKSNFLYIDDSFIFIGVGVFSDYKSNIGLSGQFVLNVLCVDAGYWECESGKRVSDFMFGVPLKIRNTNMFIIPKVGMYSIKEQNMKTAHTFDLGVELKVNMGISQLGLHVGLYQASLFLTFGG